MEPGDIVVGYVRISTKSQLDGAGLQIQRLRIQEYCEENNLCLKRIYEDRCISGTVKDRPGLLRLLNDCEKSLVNRVIVYKQDRLSRELTVALWLETQFKKYDIEVNSVVDPEYDMEDPLQKAFKRIADIFSELEKDVIVARLKEGRVNNAKKGERGSGPIAFGYVKTGNGIEIDLKQSEWVCKIFRWLIDRYSYSKIIRRLKSRSIKTNRGKDFSIESIKYMLKNGFYCGETIFGSIESKGKHKAIISKRLFNKAQNIMKKKHIKNH